MTSRDMDKYAAMRPYFEVVAEGLDGLVDGTDFFDIQPRMWWSSTSSPSPSTRVSVITVKDRKIVHWRDYLDPLAVIAAFGG